MTSKAPRSAVFRAIRLLSYIRSDKHCRARHRTTDPPQMCRPPRLAGIGSKRSVLTKATSFAAIGVVNAAIDASVFFLVLAWLDSSVLAGAAFERIARPGGSAVVTAMQLALANTIAWLVAVSGSYAMNALATFAAESGGGSDGATMARSSSPAARGWSWAPWCCSSQPKQPRYGLPRGLRSSRGSPSTSRSRSSLCSDRRHRRAGTMMSAPSRTPRRSPSCRTADRPSACAPDGDRTGAIRPRAAPRSWSRSDRREARS